MSGLYSIGQTHFGFINSTLRSATIIKVNLFNCCLINLIICISLNLTRKYSTYFLTTSINVQVEIRQRVLHKCVPLSELWPDYSLNSLAEFLTLIIRHALLSNCLVHSTIPLLPLDPCAWLSHSWANNKQIWLDTNYRLPGAVSSATRHSYLYLPQLQYHSYASILHSRTRVPVFF